MVSPLSRFHDIHDLNDPSGLQLDYRQDICSISNVAPIPILHHSTSPYHKEVDMASDYLNMNHRITFTEYLTDTSEHYISEAYEFLPPHHATTCSSPESDSYSMWEPKIKMEYSEPLDQSCSIYMSRTMSQDSCPELSVCNPSSLSTSPLTPMDSPHDQSPNMSPISHHHQQHVINEQREMIHNETMMVNDNSRGRNRGRLSTSSAQEMIQQESQHFHNPMLVSLPSPQSLPPTTKSGKLRGRRITTNKQTKPGTKSFECNYAGCGRIFKRSEHLKRHIRSIHTLERPFHCPHQNCTKRFSRSDNLSQHVRVHRPNGKEKNTSARAFSNFTPFLSNNVHMTLQQN